jgi:hypothetical protein
MTGLDGCEASGLGSTLAPVPTGPRRDIARVNQRQFDRVWAMLVELGAIERHFNDLENRYRGLASTWLLATFAAVGFVLSTQTLELPFDRELAVVALGLAGATGITLLWNLDLMVCHQLLDAAFFEGLRLERECPWLPPVRQNMMRTQGNRGVLPRVVWFYIGASAVLLLIAGAANAIWLGRHGPLAAIGAGIAWALTTVLLAGYMHTRSSRAGVSALDRSPR